MTKNDQYSGPMSWLSKFAQMSLHFHFTNGWENPSVARSKDICGCVAASWAASSAASSLDSRKEGLARFSEFEVMDAAAGMVAFERRRQNESPFPSVSGSNSQPGTHPSKDVTLCRWEAAASANGWPVQCPQDDPKITMFVRSVSDTKNKKKIRFHGTT